MLDFMTAKIDKYYLEALRKYYQASGDRKSKIVDFSSTLPSTFLSASQNIFENNEGFTVVDSFGGIRPVVLDYRFLIDGNGYTPFLVGVALDSQVVSNLHRFVTEVEGKFRDTPRGIATYKLIQWLAVHSKMGWDFNHFFYMAEAMGRNAFDEAFPYAHDYVQSMLRLQSMDDDVFLGSGQIVQDISKLEEHIERHGGKSFAEAATSILNVTSDSDLQDEIAPFIKASYAALLKIGLLQHERWDSSRKLRALFRFFQDELCLFGVREALVGALHFSGRVGKFIPVERRAKDIRGRLLASAWDLQLLRLPEYLIANEGVEKTSIYYVCTADRALRKLGGLLQVRRVCSLRHGRGHLPSSIGLRQGMLEAEIGEELANVFDEECRHILMTSGARTPLNLEELTTLVESLEPKVLEIARCS